MTDEYGIYEKAYHLVGNLLAEEFDSVRFRTYPIRNTALEIYVKNKSRLSNSMIDHPLLFLCNPYKMDLSGFVLNWGILALSPSGHSQIGAVFHHPYEQIHNMEITCGLILDHGHVSAVYGDPKKGASHKFPFTHGDIEDEYGGFAKNKNWQQIFKENPRIYSLMTYLTWIVHNSLTWALDDLLDEVE